MQVNNRYEKIIERIFLDRYTKGAKEIIFERKDIEETAASMGIDLPKNIGDIIYSFRYRADLPDSIRKKAPKEKHWIIRPAGRSRYCFIISDLVTIIPNALLAETKIPDATPGIVEKYAFNDEQGLLARLRYNRLIDIFTGITCHSLQNHLRTTVPQLGQIETDEIYVGVDQRGVHYVIPVQAKGGTDNLGIVQIEQDFALCAYKFPNLICKPVAAQFMGEHQIALFSFIQTDDGVKLSTEAHYHLVPHDEISADDLDMYNR